MALVWLWTHGRSARVRERCGLRCHQSVAAVAMRSVCPARVGSAWIRRRHSSSAVSMTTNVPPSLCCQALRSAGSAALTTNHAAGHCGSSCSARNNRLRSASAGFSQRRCVWCSGSPLIVCMIASRQISRSSGPACCQMYVDLPEPGGPVTMVNGMRDGFRSGSSSALYSALTLPSPPFATWRGSNGQPSAPQRLTVRPARLSDCVFLL